MNRRNLPYIALAWALGSASVAWSAVVPESVSTWRRNGELMIQLRDLESNANYEVGFYDVAKAGDPVGVQSVGLGKALQSIEAPSLPDGIYRILLKKDGQWIARRDSAKLELPKEGFKLLPGVVDRRSGTVEFAFPEGCLYQAIAETESGMNIRILSEWQCAAGGSRAKIDWDFWDPQRVVNYSTSPSLVIYARYIPLPSDLCVFGTPKLSQLKNSPSFSDLTLPMLHLPLKVDIEVALSKPGESLASGASVEDKVLRVELNEVAGRSLNGRKFEFLYFVNGEFVHEETDAASPSWFVLPKFPATGSPVAITVNVKDFFGNVGSHTVSVSGIGSE